MDLKERDNLRARLPVFKRRVARAEQIIVEGLKRCRNPYVAFSGGKDSEVVLRLATQQRPGIQVIWLHQGTEFPDTEQIVARLAGEWNLNLHIEYVRPGLLELLEEYGAYGTTAQSKYHEGDITRRLIIEPSRRVAERFGCDGVLMGLRRQESQGRRWIWPVRDVQYDGLLHANPVYDWRSEDIWAYITSRGLPYNTVYNKTKFQDRDSLRVAPWAGGNQKTTGRFLFLRYYYPEIWNEFRERFPNVGAYA